MLTFLRANGGRTALRDERLATLMMELQRRAESGEDVARLVRWIAGELTARPASGRDADRESRSLRDGDVRRPRLHRVRDRFLDSVKITYFDSGAVRRALEEYVLLITTRHPEIEEIVLFGSVPPEGSVLELLPE